MQRISQRVSQKNIDLGYTWFTSYLEDGHIETSRHDPRIATDNNKNRITLLQSEPHAHECLVSKEKSDSELHKRPVYEGSFQYIKK